jgi:hypothetical protein
VRLTAPLAAAAALGLAAAPAWADHPGGLRAALVFGGLALLVGAIVVILVSVFTKRDTPE